MNSFDLSYQILSNTASVSSIQISVEQLAAKQESSDADVLVCHDMPILCIFNHYICMDLECKL